jgi:sec-independent protein translocase protein TatA
MGNIGTTELILIIAVLFLFFGAKKIPELAQGLGKGIREFRKASKEIQDDIDSDTKKLENKTPEQKG